MNKELEFLEEKYGHNSWNNYPPSKQQVAQWLKEYSEKQFAISGVSNSVICCPQCGNERLESTGDGWYICCDKDCDWGDKL